MIPADPGDLGPEPLSMLDPPEDEPDGGPASA